MQKSIIIVSVIKAMVVAAIAAIVTWQTYFITYFETIAADTKYGIWHGFPFAYYFAGYQVDWNKGNMIADWNKLNFWVYRNIVFDYFVWFMLAAAILYLTEQGLKKLLDIEW